MELDGLPTGDYGSNQQQRGGHRGRGGRGGQQRQRHPEPEPGKPVDGCWFCLSSDQVGTSVTNVCAWLIGHDLWGVAQVTSALNQQVRLADRSWGVTCASVAECTGDRMPSLAWLEGVCRIS